MNASRKGRSAMTELRFETKSQSNPPFGISVTRILSDFVISKRMNRVGIRKALHMAKAISIEKII